METMVKWSAKHRHDTYRHCELKMLLPETFDMLCLAMDEWKKKTVSKMMGCLFIYIYWSRKYVGCRHTKIPSLWSETASDQPAAIRSHLLMENGLQMKYLWCEYALTRWRSLRHMHKLNHFVRQMLFYIHFPFAFFWMLFAKWEEKYDVTTIPESKRKDSW